jgi:4-oxalocrotonate tautomerase
MPIVTVHGPKVEDTDKKRKFVSTVTEAASSMFGLPQQSIVVLLRETDPANVGVGGELIADRRGK